MSHQCRMNHPDTFHVNGETPVFGFTEDSRKPNNAPGNVPCQDQSLAEPTPSPPLPPEVNAGIKLGVYPPW